MGSPPAITTIAHADLRTFGRADWCVEPTMKVSLQVELGENVVHLRVGGVPGTPRFRKLH